MQNCSGKMFEKQLELHRGDRKHLKGMSKKKGGGEGEGQKSKSKNELFFTPVLTSVVHVQK